MKRALRWILTRLQGGIEPDAVTAFGHTLFFVAAPSPGLIAHEAKHAADQAREGWKYYVKYAYFHCRYGYRLNPYEVAARERQDRIDRNEAQ